MVDGKTPIYATLLLMGLFVAAFLLFQPYSADWPGTIYAKPAQRYVRAALRQDSVALLRQSTSLPAVRWALRAARRHPDTLALWASRVEAWTGERRGDTTVVFVYPSGNACNESPIVFHFVGSGSTLRVVRASSACL